MITDKELVINHSRLCHLFSIAHFISECLKGHGKKERAFDKVRYECAFIRLLLDV